jgi:hypothetical protein
LGQEVKAEPQTITLIVAKKVAGDEEFLPE